jgi:hypothetical protein
MKLIAIQTDNAGQGEFIFGALQDAVAAERATLDDAALVEPDGGGLKVMHTKSWFGRIFGGIDDGKAKRLHAKGPAGGALVLALGAPATVEAVARRIRTVTRGDMHTFEVDGEELRELTGQDATYAVDEAAGALVEEPGATFAEGNLPDNRLDRP